MAPAVQLLVFTKFPDPGMVKTRLIPEIGPVRAARLHRRMTEHTLGTARRLCEATGPEGIGIRVCYSGAGRRKFRGWLGRNLLYEAQTAGDIGTRMAAAFRSAFRGGAHAAIAIGTDIPDLTTDILDRALTGLRSHDIVAGPAMDGGYYLIGMKRLHGELFAGIQWGTARVWDQTRSSIHRNGWSLMELNRLHDMDRPEDIAALPPESPFNPLLDMKPMVSVIIPTLNEAEALERLLPLLSCLKNVETIVSDAGSSDRTRETAEAFRTVVLKTAGGRAAQLNAGASAAKGEQLLFLHADTVPPRGFADLISTTLDDPATVAGAFRFRTDSPKLAMRVVEASANLRSVLGQWPYGDQGLFMEQRVFEEEGGFAPLQIMEDFEFVSRLRRRGRVVTLKEPAVTSARRWERLGILKTTLLNQIMIAGFLFKIPIARLEQLYRTAGNRSWADINHN